MRKALLVVAFVFGAISAPSAHADSVDASFTCATSCVDVPTDPDVTFPGPTIPINFFSQTFNLTLNTLDQFTDTYTWDVGTTSTSWYFEINDITNDISDIGPSFAWGGSGAPYGSGSVCFTHQPTPSPEPSSGGLMLLGAGIAVLVWKLKG